MACGDNKINRLGLQWQLEAADVMSIVGTVTIYWTEGEGYVRYNEDVTQAEWGPGTVLASY